MNRTITYAIDLETGLVVSRINSELAWPILEYDKMQPSNNFTAGYHLEKLPVYDAASSWNALRWTKKIPVAIKNLHREFWRFKPLA